MATKFAVTAGDTTVGIDISDNEMTWRVSVTGQRVKTFRGEFAWADAQRYANDVLTAKGCWERFDL